MGQNANYGEICRSPYSSTTEDEISEEYLFKSILDPYLDDIDLIENEVVKKKRTLRKSTKDKSKVQFIEHILKHRKKDENLEFLVQWEYGPPSWETAKSLVDFVKGEIVYNVVFENYLKKNNLFVDHGIDLC